MRMACHASGGLLATGGADRKVLVWDVDGGFCTHHFKGHLGVVTTLLFHPSPDNSNSLVCSFSFPVFFPNKFTTELQTNPNSHPFFFQ